MDTSLDSRFVERSASILSELGFKDLKTFVKSQALLMLMGKMEKFEAEIRRFEKKYGSDFETLKEKVEQMKEEEVFSEEDDYLDWRFANEVLVRLERQKQELENA